MIPFTAPSGARRPRGTPTASPSTYLPQDQHVNAFSVGSPFARHNYTSSTKALLDDKCLDPQLLQSTTTDEAYGTQTSPYNTARRDGNRNLSPEMSRRPNSAKESTASPSAPKLSLQVPPQRQVRKKRRRSDNDQSPDVNSPEQPRKFQRREQDIVNQTSPTIPDKARKQLEFWLEIEGNRPPERLEIKALVTLTRLPKKPLVAWLEYKLGRKLEDVPKVDVGHKVDVSNSNSDGIKTEDSIPGDTPQVLAAEVTNPANPEDVRVSINDYIQRASGQCTRSSHPQKNPSGDLHCTSGCGYQSKRKDDWQRHEEINQPQEIWSCIRCRTQSRRHHFIAHRKDKLIEHIKNKHADLLDKNRNQLFVERLDDLVNKSKFDVPPTFKRRCGFCGQRFFNWKKRNTHIFRHFKNKIPGGPWTMDRWRDPWPEDEPPTYHSDDDDNDQDDSPDNNPPDQGGDAGAGNNGKDTNPGSDNNDPSFGPLGDNYDYYTFNGEFDGTFSNEFDNSYEQRYMNLSNTQNLSMLQDNTSWDFSQIPAPRRSRAVTKVSLPIRPFVSLGSLGEGTYGRVDKVQSTNSGAVFARKQIKNSKGRSSVLRRFALEVNIMRRLHHPHILKAAAAYNEITTLSIIMYPVAERNLKDFLETSKSASDQDNNIWSWVGCLASAMSHVHSNRIRHGDVKPANILISGSGRDTTVYLSDFGISRVVSDTDSTSSSISPMTPMYAAPEIAQHKKHGRSADIFSLGCVFLEILTVLLDGSLSDLRQFIDASPQQNKKQNTYQTKLPQIQLWINTLRHCTVKRKAIELLSICKDMLAFNASNRPKAAEIVSKIRKGDPFGACISCLDAAGVAPAAQNIFFHSYKALTLGPFSTLVPPSAECIVRSQNGFPAQYDLASLLDWRLCPFLNWLHRGSCRYTPSTTEHSTFLDCQQRSKMLTYVVGLFEHGENLRLGDFMKPLSVPFGECTKGHQNDKVTKCYECYEMLQDSSELTSRQSGMTTSLWKRILNTTRALRALLSHRSRNDSSYCKETSHLDYYGQLFPSTLPTCQMSCDDLVVQTYTETDPPNYSSSHSIPLTESIDAYTFSLFVQQAAIFQSLLVLRAFFLSDSNRSDQTLSWSNVHYLSQTLDLFQEHESTESKPYPALMHSKLGDLGVGALVDISCSFNTISTTFLLDHLQSLSSSDRGFSNFRVQALDLKRIHLPFSFGERAHYTIPFVVSSDAPYDIVLGKEFLDSLDYTSRQQLDDLCLRAPTLPSLCHWTQEGPSLPYEKTSYQLPFMHPKVEEPILNTPPDSFYDTTMKSTESILCEVSGEIDGYVQDLDSPTSNFEPLSPTSVASSSAQNAQSRVLRQLSTWGEHPRDRFLHESFSAFDLVRDPLDNYDSDWWTPVGGIPVDIMPESEDEDGKRGKRTRNPDKMKMRIPRQKETRDKSPVPQIVKAGLRRKVFVKRKRRFMHSAGDGIV